MNIGPESQPLTIFSAWMAEAKADSRIREANAMMVATSSPSELHARVVLCKSWTEAGFTFYTNYNSLKGQDLEYDSRVAAVFYWYLARQVCVSGRVQKTSRAESEAYWNSRPRDSQLSQHISRQSSTVSSREVLHAAWAAAEKEFAGRSIPCPGHWGGYVIVPDRIEFWIGQPGRLHDRFLYEKESRGWTFRRLCP